MQRENPLVSLLANYSDRFLTCADFDAAADCTLEAVAAMVRAAQVSLVLYDLGAKKLLLEKITGLELTSPSPSYM